MSVQDQKVVFNNSKDQIKELYLSALKNTGSSIESLDDVPLNHTRGDHIIVDGELVNYNVKIENNSSKLWDENIYDLRYYLFNFRKHLTEYFPTWSDFFTQTPDEIGLGTEASANYADVLNNFIATKIDLPSNPFSSVIYRGGKYLVSVTRYDTVSRFGSFVLHRENPGDSPYIEDYHDGATISNFGSFTYLYTCIWDKQENKYVEDPLKFHFHKGSFSLEGSNFEYFSKVIIDNDYFSNERSTETATINNDVTPVWSYRSNVETMSWKDFNNRYIGITTDVDAIAKIYVEKLTELSVTGEVLNLSDRHVYVKRALSIKRGIPYALMTSMPYEFDEDKALDDPAHDLVEFSGNVNAESWLYQPPIKKVDLNNKRCILDKGLFLISTDNGIKVEQRAAIFDQNSYYGDDKTTYIVDSIPKINTIKAKPRLNQHDLVSWEEVTG